jgi:hypothetical protein
MRQIADIGIDVIDFELGDNHDILDSLNLSMDPTGMLFIMCTLFIHGYMALLGKEGSRWADKVCGIAILGTEACFSYPKQPSDPSGPIDVSRRGNHIHRKQSFTFSHRPLVLIYSFRLLFFVLYYKIFEGAYYDIHHW